MAALAQWRGELEGQQAVVVARQAEHEAQAQAAYITRLRARHQRAVEAGEAAAASRYEDLLSATGASTDDETNPK